MVYSMVGEYSIVGELVAGTLDFPLLIKGKLISNIVPKKNEKILMFKLLFINKHQLISRDGMRIFCYLQEFQIRI